MHVILTAHEDTPEDDGSNDRHSRRVGRKRLSNGGEDDQDEFQTVHLLAANHVCKVTETELSNDRSCGCGDLGFHGQYVCPRLEKARARDCASTLIAVSEFAGITPRTALGRLASCQ
jgi:hypothetical protein